MLTTALGVSGVVEAYGIDYSAFNKYQAELTSKLCDNKSFEKCYQMDPAHCHKDVEKTVNGCFTTTIKERQQQPEGLQDELKVTALKVAQCIDRETKARFGAFKLSTPECRNF